MSSIVEDNKTKIMVVEDKCDLRTALVELLRRAGYNVVEAAEGGEAWRLMHQEVPPGLIITDLRMPRINGFRLIANLRSSEVLGTIPIIIASGEDMLPDIAAAVGAAGWLEKPSKREQLLEVVSAALQLQK